MENCSHNRVTLNVSVGIIVNNNREVLVTRRSLQVSQPDLWEFPGGKLEPNEDSYTALCREIREEIGIEVLDASFFMRVPYPYDDYEVVLDVWRINRYQREPRGAQGQSMRWVPIRELLKYPFPAANKSIIVRLQE